MQFTKKSIALVIALAMILMSFSSVFAIADNPSIGNSGSVLSNIEDSSGIDPNADVMILVKVDGTPALQQTKSVNKAVKAAERMLKELPSQVKRVEASIHESIEVKDSYALLFHGFSFKGKYWMLEQINKLDGISAFIPAEFQTVTDDGDVLTPSTSNSTVTIGAQEAWNMGYTGEGALIAILDTGIRHTHEAFSVMPNNPKVDVQYLQNIVDNYGSLVHFGTDASQLFYSSKQAFNWDYYDNDYDPNHTASDHGTHVAGIAAGNNGSDFKGVAPDAQLAVMQVFEASGSAYFSTLLTAMEDCVYLGVDSINMSLGSPAGFSSPYTGVTGMADVYEALESVGIAVNVAAGNDSNNILWTTYGDWFVSNYKGLSSNPDYGIIGSPASFEDSFAVGSVVNGDANTGYLTINNKDFYYTNVADIIGLGTIPGDYPIVYGGFGSPEELAEAGVEGAIALIQRGNGITFSDKCTNAEAAGAVGVILYNNVSGSFNPSVASNIPLGLLTLGEGENLVAELPDGVHGSCTIVGGISYGSIPMASSSSWGTTSDLLIKPEICAPGDGITSAIGLAGDTSYESWSGTSMATPHIAAAISIIKQRLREIFPGSTEATINQLAYAFAMSTANQVKGFVRQQGAGLIDIVKAISTDVYLTVPGSDRPKLEVGENENGTFTFTFVLNNIGSTDHTYTIVPYAMTEEATDGIYSGSWIHQETPTEVKLLSGSVKDVTNMVEIDAPETITVAAGSTATVTMTLSATEELMNYINGNFPVGIYLEGFIKLIEQADEGINLSIPFLGYVGDWDEPSMLDRGYYWQAATGEVNYHQFLTPDYNMAGYGAEQGLGVNQYADMTGQTYLTDRNAISPNGDGILDAFNFIEFTLLRNAREIKLVVEDQNGNVLDTLYDINYSRKDYYGGGFGSAGESWHDIVFNFDGSTLAENETVNLVLETYLDHDGYTLEANESGRWVIPVTKDTQAPALLINGGTLNIIDENYVAYFAVYSDAELTNCMYETGVFENERGIASIYQPETDHYYVTTADYAGNEAVYEVAGDVVIEIGDSFLDRGRTIIGFATENYATNRCENSWISFAPGKPAYYDVLSDVEVKPIDSSFFGGEYQYQASAVDANGIVYTLGGEGANDGDILRLDPETFETEVVWDHSQMTGTTAIRNIAFDPDTNDCIVMVYSYNNPELGSGSKFAKLDLSTGKIMPFASAEGTWGMDTMGNGRIIYYDGNRSLTIMDYEGTVLDTIVMSCFDPQYSSNHIGTKGYTGSLLYDEQHNSVFVGSHWSWLRYNMYSTGGIFEYDLDTDTFSVHRVGNGMGRVVMGMFFADEIFNETVELTDFSLDKTGLEIYYGGTDTINFVRTPENANNYELVWTSSDENIATVTGNNRKATVTAGNTTGDATIICTVYVDGEVFGSCEANVSVDYDPELAEALNVEGGHLIFSTTNPYPFVPVSDGDRYYVESTNQNISDSSSVLATTIVMSEGDTLSFDYQVGSETDYDFFRFTVNGEEVFSDSGTNKPWLSYSYTAPADGSYTFIWRFDKDPYTEEDFDGVRIDNVAFRSSAGPLMGDINGNGVIETSDAIILMRYCMGLISLTDEQLAIADMNGDGAIRINDSVLICRTALHIS